MNSITLPTKSFTDIQAQIENVANISEESASAMEENVATKLSGELKGLFVLNKYLTPIDNLIFPRHNSVHISER